MAIFISYRRQDTAGYAGRLYDRLAGQFGDDQVFMDVTDLSIGQDFVDAINQKLDSCEALIVLIGDRWLNAIDDGGRIRVEDPADFVRVEVGAALRRGILVVPVLVGGAKMPKRPQLPAELQALTRRNALELSHERFGFDADRLAEALARALGVEVSFASQPAARVAMPAAASTSNGATQAGGGRMWMWIALAAVTILAVGGVLAWQRLGDHQSERPDKAARPAKADKRDRPTRRLRSDDAQAP